MTQAHLDGATRPTPPRVPVRLRVRLSSMDSERDPTDGSSYYRVCEDTCINLSEKGAQITGEEPLEVGKRVLIELELPESKSFEAVARVAWSQVLKVGPDMLIESGTGVEFIDVSPPNQRLLVEYVGTQLRRVRSRRVPHSGRSTALRT
jgi:hypothetical protein